MESFSEVHRKKFILNSIKLEIFDTLKRLLFSSITHSSSCRTALPRSSLVNPPFMLSPAKRF